MIDQVLNVDETPRVDASSSAPRITTVAKPSSAANASHDGRFPIVGAVLLCAAAAMLGAAADHRFFQIPQPAPKVAFAEQGAVVLEAVLGQPAMKPEDATRLVGDTLHAVLEKYQRAGYLVVNVTHSADNQLLISAIPNGAVDITAEMRSDVARAIAHAASAPDAANRK